MIGTLGLGGAEQYVIRIVPLLERHGIETEVCALELSGALVPVARAAGINLHTTSFRYRATRARWWQRRELDLLQAVRELQSLIRQRHFDIVHSYLFVPDVVATAAAKLAGCGRIIISRRSLHSFRHGENAHEHLLEAATCLLAHELIANSRTVLRDAEAHELLLPRRRTVIYNGVDVGSYGPATLRASGPLRILVVGALHPRKGQEFAVRALALMTAAGVDAVLTFVGEGPDEPMLNALATQLGLSDRVRFAGPTLDPRESLQECDVFLLPSRQEGFSNALLEAMASGLPVVATDVGGNAEAVVDGEGGVIVPPQDSAALAAALIDLNRRRGEFQSMGAANRRRVAQQFTLERSAFHLANWYRDSGVG